MRCEEKHGYVGLSVHHSLCTLDKPLDCTKEKAWRRADAALGWGMGRRQGSVSIRRRRIIRTIHSQLACLLTSLMVFVLSLPALVWMLLLVLLARQIC